MIENQTAQRYFTDTDMNTSLVDTLILKKLIFASVIIALLIKNAIT